MARCSGREHPRGTTFALRMNGRMRFVSHRYCGSKTSISPNFVCQRSFFTLAMHRRLLTNFSLRRFDLVLGPALYRRPPQKPHFLDNPLFDRVGLLEISLRIRYRHRYRYESIAKTRVRLKNCRKRRVAEFRRRHLPSLLVFQTESLLRITLNRTPPRELPLAKARPVCYRARPKLLRRCSPVAQW